MNLFVNIFGELSVVLNQMIGLFASDCYTIQQRYAEVGCAAPENISNGEVPSDGNTNKICYRYNVKIKCISPFRYYYEYFCISWYINLNVFIN